MLVLSRLVDEEIVITCEGVEIRVAVLELRRGGVRLGFAAPPHVVVDRAEVHQDKLRERRGA